MITLTMDNGSCNDFKRFLLTLNMLKLLKSWQKVILIGERQQKYKSIYERLLSIGSSRYDEFILYCHKLGY